MIGAMIGSMISIVILVWLLTVSAPHLTGDNKQLHITFDPSPIAACTVFTSLTETIVKDGKTIPYAPRHCWFFGDSPVSSYDDDWSFIQPNHRAWNVQAEIQYQDSTQKSNVIRVIY